MGTGSRRNELRKATRTARNIMEKLGTRAEGACALLDIVEKLGKLGQKVKGTGALLDIVEKLGKYKDKSSGGHVHC